MTRCARKARPPGSWGGQARAPKFWARSGRRSGLDVEAIAALFSGEGHAPATLTEAERARLAAADLSAPRACRRGFSRVASRPVRGELRRVRRGGGQGARRACAGRPAREPSQGHARQGAPRARPSQPEPRRSRLSGLRIAMRPDGRAPPLASDRPTSRASSSCRTRARSSPRSSPRRSPACRSSTFARARAARRWRSPPRWRTRARSTPPTPTRIALRRSSRGSRARARAMSRCGRRRDERTARRPRRALRSRADRCALHRLRPWRRNPDAKWRIRPGALEQRIKEQDETLEARSVSSSGADASSM